MPSRLDEAKRELVKILRDLGQAYGCPVSLRRECSEQELKTAYRAVALKVHPDKPGGSTEDFMHLYLGKFARSER